ncbi:SDR family NAD(P)-dependent oxidoreductase [Streptomyces fagopyri]|uniref:SDR family NAD(P)-dependent oxidoreductase n=1 Tax=Streptomyces fagopyri TaxID=2662397 RepID=UPI0037111D97
MALGTAVIVGVGPGLGLALARTFADAGHPVALLARDKARLDTYAGELASAGHEVRSYATDAADPDDLRAALHSAITESGAPDVLGTTSGCFARTRRSVVTIRTGPESRP